MVIQLRGITDEFIAELKAATNERTASGAFHHAAACFVRMSDLIDELKAENKRLRYSLVCADQKISDARGAARLLLEHTSQENLDLPEGQ